MSLRYFLTERCPACDRLSAPIYRDGWGAITGAQAKDCERCRARTDADRAKYDVGAHRGHASDR